MALHASTEIYPLRGSMASAIIYKMSFVALGADTFAPDAADRYCETSTDV
jgi:hypothetical protein